MLSIDIGWNSIKLAAILAGCATPQVLKLAADGIHTIPLQAYVPKSGPIQVGAIAREFIHRDPAGSIGDVGALLGQNGHVFRNGRRISIRDIAAAFFHHIKESLSHEYSVEHCIITSTLNPWADNDPHLIAAAGLGGFSHVEWQPTATCIAKFAKTHMPLLDGVYAILDLGAGHSKLFFVEIAGDETTLIPEWPPRYSIGVRTFEAIVYDFFRPQMKTPLPDAKIFHLFRHKVLQLKHNLQQAIQDGGPHEIAFGPENLRLSASELVHCNRQCLTDCLQLLSQSPRSHDPMASQAMGMLVAGGGAKMPGLRDTIRAEGWDLPIQLLESPEYACVLGSALESTPMRPRQPDSSNAAGTAVERPYQGVQTTRTATKKLQCSDRACQTWNESYRLYCFRCGTPLNDNLST